MHSIRKSLSSLVLGTALVASAVDVVPTNITQEKIVMEDVTGDGLKDILLTKGEEVYVQKNLGHGRYADPILLEQARQRGNYGAKSEHERIEDGVIRGAVIFGSAFLALIGYVIFKSYRYRNTPYDETPWMWRD